MFGPSMNSTHLANARHADRLDHAARIRAAHQERRGDSPVTSLNHRLLTVRRLAAGKVHAVVGSLTLSPTTHR